MRCKQEAMRVHTPPLKEDTADGRPRGLFFDVRRHTGSPYPDTTPTKAEAKVKTATYQESKSVKTREWWDAPKALVRPNLVQGLPTFEFQVPEHLPSSPMCPTNPKHKSRGRGVCVVGRSILSSRRGDVIEYLGH